MARQTVLKPRTFTCRIACDHSRDQCTWSGSGRYFVQISGVHSHRFSSFSAGCTETVLPVKCVLVSTLCANDYLLILPWLKSSSLWSLYALTINCKNLSTSPFEREPTVSFFGIVDALLHSMPSARKWQRRTPARMAETEMGRIFAVGRWVWVLVGKVRRCKWRERVSELATETVCLIYCALVLEEVGVHVRPCNWHSRLVVCLFASTPPISRALSLMK